MYKMRVNLLHVFWTREPCIPTGCQTENFIWTVPFHQVLLLQDINLHFFSMMSFKMIQNNFCCSHDREQPLHLKDGLQNSICPVGSWHCIDSSLCLTEKTAGPCTQMCLGLVEVFSVIALFKWLVGCVKLVLKGNQVDQIPLFWLRRHSANSCTFHRVPLSVVFVTCAVRAASDLRHNHKY